MTTDQPQKPPSQLAPADAEAIKHLKQAIASGKHWYTALLEAIGLWQAAEETVDGRSYQYLIAGEAFDWLLLAERLCQAVDGLLPEDERMALLFQGKPPLGLTADKFKGLIGGIKYHLYLNYFYGITAEEALIQAVEDGIRKEKQNQGISSERDITDEVYCRIYDARQHDLLKQFRRQMGYSQARSIGLAELKEFTYWLFKYRLKHCDQARVASDTKKALNWLQSNTAAGVSPGF